MRLACASSPETVVAHLVETAPRGENKKAPRALSQALAYLPTPQATAAVEGLLANPEVTPQAKSFYRRAYLERPEPEAVSVLIRIAERRQMTEQERIDTAYAIANARAFLADRVAYEKAIAQKDSAGANAARGRIERRQGRGAPVFPRRARDRPRHER